MINKVVEQLDEVGIEAVVADFLHALRPVTVFDARTQRQVNILRQLPAFEINAYLE